MRAARLRFGAGGVVYVAAVGLAFVSAVATLVVHALLGLYYCFDQLAPVTAQAPVDPQ